MTIFCNQSYMNIVHLCLSEHLIVLYSPFLWWCEMTKCLRDETQCSEWCRCCDIADHQYWPSDHISQGRSSASQLPLTRDNWNLRKQNHRQGGCLYISLLKSNLQLAVLFFSWLGWYYGLCALYLFLLLILTFFRRHSNLVTVVFLGCLEVSTIVFVPLIQNFNV